MTNTDEMECQCSMIYSPAHVQVDYEAVSMLIHDVPIWTGGRSVVNEDLKRTIHVVGLTDRGMLDKYLRGRIQGGIFFVFSSSASTTTYHTFATTAHLHKFQFQVS